MAFKFIQFAKNKWEKGEVIFYYENLIKKLNLWVTCNGVQCEG